MLRVTAGASGAFNVRNGEMARLTGTDTVQQEVSGAPPLDAFDGWTSERDAREDRATISARYVPREMIGYEDLDANGRWVNIPPYGMVWQPNVAAAGWAPYRQGHWAWVDPWGWTWIDDMPWGFAPFHYGRWAYVGTGWYWVPGAVAVRPVYSPALVAFVGGGGIGVGVAAWFPLGPGEVYRPAYHVSEVYVRNVNVAYVSNVSVIASVGPAVYVNQRVVGAVTVVPHEVFVGARPVGVAVVAVRPEMLVSARVVGYTAPIAPERVSVLARPVGGAVVVRTPPAVFVQRTVVARTAAAPAACQLRRASGSAARKPGPSARSSAVEFASRRAAAASGNGADGGYSPRQPTDGIRPQPPVQHHDANGPCDQRRAPAQRPAHHRHANADLRPPGQRQSACG